MSGRWIFEAAGIEPTADQRRNMALGRYFLCVAIDCAPRCILGIKLAASASTADALATLWLALIDKSAMARALGCRAGWHQAGHITQVVVDNGSSFVSSEFKAAVADLGIGYDVMSAGVPKPRGRIERMMRTFAQNMMPFMTGRTFSNPVERGEYPSEAYAVHTAQDLVDAFLRYIWITTISASIRGWTTSALQKRGRLRTRPIRCRPRKIGTHCAQYSDWKSGEGLAGMASS